MLQFVHRNLRRFTVALAGTVLLISGLILLPTPIPLGIVLIPAGLIVLATEFHWAHRTMGWVKTRTGAFGRGVAASENAAKQFVERRFGWLIPRSKPETVDNEPRGET